LTFGQITKTYLNFGQINKIQLYLPKYENFP